MCIRDRLQIDHFSLTTGRIAFFPIQVNKLDFKSTGSNGSLYVDLSLNLLKDDEGGNGIRTVCLLYTSRCV